MDKDWIALVTGAGRRTGIGFEVCRQLATAGMRVVLTGRNADAARACADELAAEGLAVTARRLDVTDAPGLQSLAADLEREFGRLDVLVNNAAGTTALGDVPSTTDLQRAHEVMEATLFGSWRVTQVLLPLLRRSARGRIVNVSSGAGSHGDPMFGLTTDNAMGPGYSVAKAALNALTSAFARELQGSRIIVNAVCPGFTATFPGAERMGARPVQEGAASVVWAATLPDGGPTGGFFRNGKQLPW